MSAAHDSTVSDLRAAAGRQATAPRQVLHMSTGRWAYSLAEAGEPARGVYRQDRGHWVQVGPLPYVLDRIVHRDGSGGRTTFYRIALSPLADADDIAIVEQLQLKDGTWRDSLDVAFSYDDKITKAVAGAIAEIARQAPKSEATARWAAGELHLPALDVRPTGYGLSSPAAPADARAGWAEIATIAARNPRLALVLGAALGSLYVSPLEWQSHIVLMTGGGGQGKTTGLRAAGAVLGDMGTNSRPGIVKPWNATMNGVPALLGELGCLPAFLDEMGATKMSAADLEALVFKIAQGGSRLQAKKTPGTRSTASWAGTLFGTGNSSIAGRIANDGIARRVLEVPVPIVGCAADADRVAELLRAHYGWPLRWLMAEGMDVDGFAERVRAAREEIGQTPGGAPAETTIAGHLAFALAGARRLGELIGVELGAVVLDEARERLCGAAWKLAERGANAGDRLLEAVHAAWTSRPGAFPTRSAWAHAQASGDGMRRDTEGFDVTDDAFPGHLAVMAGRLQTIAEDGGIEDHAPGLDDLFERGVVVRGRDRGRRTYDVKMIAPARSPKPERTYLFAFPDALVDAAETGTGDQSAPTGGDRPTVSTVETVTSTNASRGVRDDVVPAPSGGPRWSPVVPGTGDHDADALTSRNADVVPVVPAVPGDLAPKSCEVSDSDPDLIDPDGVAGPVRRVRGATPGPCRVCGAGPAPFRDRIGPVHPFTCARVDVADPATAGTGAESAVAARPASTPAVDTPRAGSAAQRAAQPRSGAVPEPVGLAGVLDAAGLWLPGADGPLTTESGLCWPADAGQAYALAVEHRISQLWIHPSAHPRLEIPTAAERAGGISPAAAEAHPWAESEHVTGDPAGGLAAWVNLTPTDPDTGDGPRRALVFPAYESRAPWATARDGRELLAGVLALAGALGSVEKRDARYYFSPNETSAAVLRSNLAAIKHPRTDKWAPPVLKLPDDTFTEDGTPVGVESFRLPRAQWTRPGGLLDEEDVAGAWVHAYDRNGAQPAVFGGLHLAHHLDDGGGPVFVDVDPARMSPARVKTGEGYYLVSLDGGKTIDSRLPALTGPWEEGSPDECGAVWMTGEWLTRLQEIGAGVQVHRAVVARVVERWMRQFQTTFSHGRAALIEATHGHPPTCVCGSCVALATFKAAFRSRVGAFAQDTESKRLYRPDVRDMIVTKAYANQHRAASKFAGQSGRFPLAQFVDTLYYVGHSPDPEACNPSGMKLGTKLNEWKPEGSVPLAAIRDHDGWEKGLHRVFVDERNSIGGAR